SNLLLREVLSSSSLIKIDSSHPPFEELRDRFEKQGSKGCSVVPTIHAQKQNPVHDKHQTLHTTSQTTFNHSDFQIAGADEAREAEAEAESGAPVCCL